MLSPRLAFQAGVRAFAPIIIGVIPFALVSGVAVVSVGLSVPMALGMSVIVFAGSAQLVAAQLIGANAPALLIIAAAFIVNLRFMMYSASLAPYLRQRPRWLSWLGAYLLTDQAYAIAVSHFNQHPEAANKYWYYLGAGLTMWTTWQIGTLVGIALGTQIPAGWQLEFAIPLTFIALVVPGIKNKRFGAVAVTSGVVAALSALLPFKLGLVLSVLVGVGVGLWLEARAK